MISALLALFFLSASAIHVYWAAGGRSGTGAVLPEVDGKPLRTPSAGTTGLVAFLFAAVAALVLGHAGLFPLPLPPPWPGRLLKGIAAIFALRAVGEFNYLGFFKRVRGSRFARLDTLLYSPLCAAVACGLWAISRS
ncbi:MAG: DUF3995 domain-containing protein [Holophagaceae bacterium]|nr:DUF3995 domain-containing protein [Holophagaceae bacterium]